MLKPYLNEQNTLCIHSQVPISHILPETMETFLDEFCLNSVGNVTNNHFNITARFDFLAPPKPENLGYVSAKENDGKGIEDTSIM